MCGAMCYRVVGGVEMSRKKIGGNEKFAFSRREIFGSDDLKIFCLPPIFF
jgi:hypothetical protein